MLCVNDVVHLCGVYFVCVPHELELENSMPNQIISFLYKFTFLLCSVNFITVVCTFSFHFSNRICTKQKKNKTNQIDYNINKKHKLNEIKIKSSQFFMRKWLNCNLVAMAMRMWEQQVDNALVQNNRNRIQMERPIRRKLNEPISTVGPFVLILWARLVHHLSAVTRSKAMPVQ